MKIIPLGLCDYREVDAAMRAHTAARGAGTEDEIWLVEHPPVFTQGVAGRALHVHDAGGIPVKQSNRGGQVTYHGPGQVLAYPLIDLRRSSLGVRSLVDKLQDAAVNMLAEFGIPAQTKADAPGVYVGSDKIMALGLRIRRGCSFHGLALNVCMDLAPFARINPCGFIGLRHTCLYDEIGRAHV